MAEPNKQIVRRYLAAGERNDFAVWDALCDVDMVLDPGFMPPIHGLEAVKQFTAGMHSALSDFYLRADELVGEGDVVAARWTTGGVHSAPMATPVGTIPPPNKPVAMSGMSMIRLRDGKIVEERTQADILGFMQQLGAIPQPEGSPA
jgi:predicted ester cyclase